MICILHSDWLTPECHSLIPHPKQVSNQVPHGVSIRMRNREPSLMLTDLLYVTTFAENLLFFCSISSFLLVTFYCHSNWRSGDELFIRVYFSSQCSLFNAIEACFIDIKSNKTVTMCNLILGLPPHGRIYWTCEVKDRKHAEKLFVLNRRSKTGQVTQTDHSYLNSCCQTDMSLVLLYSGKW